MAAKHATASVFLFARVGRRWCIALVYHPRFQRWMLPGGHVEEHESPAEAALREVVEETGFQARIVGLPRGMTSEPLVIPAVVSPLWIIEEEVPAETRLPEGHVHVDHLFLATTTAGGRGTGEHELRWFNKEELEGLRMFDATRALSRSLFLRMDEVTPLFVDR